MSFKFQLAPPPPPAAEAFPLRFRSPDCSSFHTKMAKRGYKLQEFEAHSAGVNCLNIGKKACRLLVTGGEDHRVNLWSIGKPSPLMSLCGHTSPVECVVFDSTEILVLGGASTGAIKLWDLEEAKMVRTLSGHKSNCTALEFHPFGEFFASGSLDTNLKIWDTRKKGCINTYKGHTGGIGTIRFTPDGRWVVSGGFDNALKIWDLTSGKLLHDFKSHEGHIQSIDFHPLEFLLATGSADRTVKFWDLETFELIGSSRPEATGVRSITFHPDGRTLLCGLNDGLKVYSWEPVICHDTIDMGWSTLGDLCIHEGKLLGCSYYQSSVGVWVADVSFMDPFGTVLEPEQTGYTLPKINLKGRQFSENKGGSKPFGSQCLSPEHETIKNIYVDFTGGEPVSSQRVGPESGNLLDSKDIFSAPTQKQSAAVVSPLKSSGQVINTGGKPVSSQRVGPLNHQEFPDSLDLKGISNLPTQKQNPVVVSPFKSSGQVITTGGKPISPQRVGPLNHQEFSDPLDLKEISNLSTQKQNPVVVLPLKSSAQANATGGKTVSSQRVGPLNYPELVDPLNSKDINSLQRSSAAVSPSKSYGQVMSEPLNNPELIDSLDSKEISSLLTQKQSPSVDLPSKSSGPAITTSGRLASSHKVGHLNSPELVDPLDSKEISRLPTQNRSLVDVEPAKLSDQPITTSGNPVSSQRFGHSNSPDLVDPLDSKEISSPATKKQSPAVGPPLKSLDTGGKPFSSQRVGPLSSPELIDPLDFKEISGMPIQKRSPAIVSPLKSSGHAKTTGGKPVSSQIVGPLNYPELVDPLDSKKISSFSTHKRSPAAVSPSKVSGHAITTGRKPVSSRRNSPALLVPVDSKEINNFPTQKRSPAVSLPSKSTGQAIGGSFVVPTIVPRDNSDGKFSTNSRRESITTGRADTVILPKPAHKVVSSKSKNTERLSVGVESGAFCKMESDLNGVDSKLQTRPVVEDEAKEYSKKKHPNSKIVAEKRGKNRTVLPRDISDGKSSTNSRRESIITVRPDTVVSPKPVHEQMSSKIKYKEKQVSMTVEPGTFCSMESDLDSVDSKFQTRVVVEDDDKEFSGDKHPNGKIIAEKFEKTSSPATISCQKSSDESPLGCSKGLSSGVVRGRTRSLVERFERENFSSEDQATVRTSSIVEEQSQTSEKISAPPDDDDVTKDLMQNHDLFLSTLHSRLTKLQVMRKFWEQNDIKGAISTMRKLPDHSVQADIISVLMDKMEILTLDLFSYLLPVLTSLLNSNMERHATISLEMLLKLVAVFGQTVQSTISAPRSVGVDLHAEHRLECCKQCSIELQKIEKILPALVKRGGVLAKCAQELSLLLQAA